MCIWEIRLWFPSPGSQGCQESPVKMQMSKEGTEQWVVTYFLNLTINYFIGTFIKTLREWMG